MASPYLPSSESLRSQIDNIDKALHTYENSLKANNIDAATNALSQVLKGTKVLSSQARNPGDALMEFAMQVRSHQTSWFNPTRWEIQAQKMFRW